MRSETLPHAEPGMFPRRGEETVALPQVAAFVPGYQQEDGRVKDSDGGNVDFVEPAGCQDELEREQDQECEEVGRWSVRE